MHTADTVKVACYDLQLVKKPILVCLLKPLVSSRTRLFIMLAVMRYQSRRMDGSNSSAGDEKNSYHCLLTPGDTYGQKYFRRIRFGYLC
jgi:hypothetical protein